jgi:hypothetical protein
MQKQLALMCKVAGTLIAVVSFTGIYAEQVYTKTIGEKGEKWQINKKNHHKKIN